MAAVVVVAVTMVVQLTDAGVRVLKRAREDEGEREEGGRERESTREAYRLRSRWLDKERNENGCGSSLACKMLRRRYHTARD